MYTWLDGTVNQDVLLFTQFWYIGTSLTKGNFSKPILLLFVILCIYNSGYLLYEQEIHDWQFSFVKFIGILGSNTISSEYFFSLFFFFSILHTVAAAAGSYMEADVLCFALLYTPFSPIWHTLEDFQRIYQIQIFFIFRICWPWG